MSLEINLRGKVALVTGVSSGIGAAIAKMLTRAGATVIGCGKEELSEAFIRLSDLHGVEVMYVVADVTKNDDLVRLVDSVVQRFGKIDLLISNAGQNVFEGTEHCNEDKWQYNLDLNLAAHWRLAKLCKRYLEQTGNGTIIIITSNHAFSTIPGCFPYNVAKTALTGLVRSLAVEWAPHIRTVGLAPGFIDTPGNQQWFDSFSDSTAERQRTINLHPVKRIGTPEEVGAWCVFLASDFASFASGTTYLLDGGRSALMQDA